MKQIIVVIFALLIFGCATEPGPTTGDGAALGAVIGAGLGAIIGSQTGDAGAGVAIRAVAGAGIGGVVANQFEAQEQVIAKQDEALTRQEETIRAQTRELQSIRSMQDGKASFNKKPINNPRWYEPPPEQRAALPATDSAPSATSSGSASSFVQQRGTDDECEQATAEMARGDNAKDPSEQLFHYRRARRLCPQNPEYSVALGAVYSTLRRPDDARFEFERALGVDPTNRAAQEGLAAIRKPKPPIDRY